MVSAARFWPGLMSPLLPQDIWASRAANIKNETPRTPITASRQPPAPKAAGVCTGMLRAARALAPLACFYAGARRTAAPLYSTAVSRLQLAARKGAKSTRKASLSSLLVKQQGCAPASALRAARLARVLSLLCCALHHRPPQLSCCSRLQLPARLRSDLVAISQAKGPQSTGPACC